MLIAECKDNAYLYREETPINKVLKFSVYSRAVLNKCDPNFKGPIIAKFTFPNNVPLSCLWTPQKMRKVLFFSESMS